VGNIIKCIVAEDYEPLNNIYSNLLNYEKDIEVVGRAYNGSQLLQLLNDVKADVILLDIEMATPNEGINICKQILKKYMQIKIVMLTCHEEEDKIISAFEAGLDILKLLLHGKKQREIAEIRNVELATVKAHVSSILRKFETDRTSNVISKIKHAGLENFIDELCGLKH